MAERILFSIPESGLTYLALVMVIWCFCCPVSYAGSENAEPGEMVYEAVFSLTEPHFSEKAVIAQDLQEPLQAFIKTYRDFQSSMTTPTPKGWEERMRQEKRVRLERAMVCLLPGPEIKSAAARYAEKAELSYEWEGFSQGPLSEAAQAEAFLHQHPDSPLAPFLYIFIAHRCRAALECSDLKKDDASRKKIEERGQSALIKASRSINPLIKLLVKTLETRKYVYRQR